MHLDLAKEDAVMTGEGGVDIRKLLRTPLEVTWTVTSRCNLRCPYCLEDALPPDAPDDAAEETRELIVRELIANDILKVYVSGGEPLLVPSVPEYVARLRESGAVVRLTTNGTLVDEQTVDRLAAARLSAAEVSLQPGEAERVRRAVALLVARGIRTVLRIVVTSGNCSRVEEIVSPFVGSGVERIALQEVMPLGRAASDAGKYALGVEALRVVRDRVGDMNRRWGDGFVGFASATLVDVELGQPVPCALGERARKSCEIEPDGNVIPCGPATAYGVRNMIPEKGLAGCWRDMPGLYAPLVRARPGGGCESCLSVGTCGGGCRAISFLLTGRTSAGNPACRLLRPVPPNGATPRRSAEGATVGVLPVAEPRPRE